MRNCLTRLMAILLLMGLAACTAKSANTGNSSSGGGSSSEGQYQEVHYYYDFDDILIHKDLKYDIKSSTVLETDSFKVGLQVFNGRIEPLSLVNFFLENMSKDGWKNMYTLKGKSSDLIFEKAGKRCTIKVIDEPFSSTRVEIQAVEIKGQPETSRSGTATKSGYSSGASAPAKSSGGSTGGSSGSGTLQDRTLSQ